MPHSHTYLRASSVARSMSLEAPVFIWLNISSSAPRPPMRMAILSSTKRESTV